MAHDFKPAVPAIWALSDGRRRLGRAAEAFHLFGPEQAFGSIGFT
jgi:hypothetical protein